MTSHSSSFTLLQKETTIVGLPAIDFPQLIPNDRAPSFIIICCVLFSLPSNSSLERFSIECRKIKTSVIPLANQEGHTIQGANQNSKQILVADAKRGKPGATESRLVLFSDWMTKWRDFFKPIVSRDCTKPSKRVKSTIWFPDWYEGFFFKQDEERGKEDQESKPENEPAPKADGTTAE